MARIARALFVVCLVSLPLPAALAQTAAQTAAPSVSIQSEMLYTQRPPPLFRLRSQVVGLTRPLHFSWDLGNGMRRDGPEVLEQRFEIGRYNIVLSVRDAAGRVRTASLTLDVEPQGCAGM